MKCKVCGRELKGNGNICRNCYNEKQKQKAMKQDSNLIWELKSTFKLSYELLKMIDFFVIGIIIIFAVVANGNILLDIVTILVVVAVFFVWIGYRKKRVPQETLSFYDTKIVYKNKNKEKSMLYSDVNDIGYYQDWKQKFTKVGEIRFMPENSIVVMQGINIKNIVNVEAEFENVKDIFREKINVEVK